MFKNVVFIVLVCLPLLLNCAGHRKAENDDGNSPAHNFMPVYRTGFDVKGVKDGLFIETIDADSPAKAAGMQKGDFIVSVNGKTISHKEFLKFMQENKGEDVHFTISRYNQISDYTITPKLYFNCPLSVYKIYELSVINEQKVNLAIIVTEVRDNTSERDYSWEESMRRQVQRDIENNVLNNLDCQERLSFVDRSRLDEIVDAYRLNMTGLTSDGARTKISQTTGATHLLVITFARNSKRIKDRESCQDTVTETLMEIENGKVLATDQSISACKQTYAYTSHNQ